MKIEELQKIKLNAKRPNKNMTDESWQIYFAAMKLLTLPSNKRKMSCKDSPILINSYSYDMITEYNETQWRRYKEFINGILYTIRHGQCDYCFYIYHIAELLKYEHDNLRTKWLPEDNCFKVWLDDVSLPRQEI